MRTMISCALGLAAMLQFCACGSATDLTAASSGPSITITSPAGGSTLVVNSSNPEVPIEFRVGSFTLMPPGTCADVAGCGHVEVFVDAMACNNPAPHPYNSIGAESPIVARLDYCPTLYTTHVITAELHFDDLTPVTDAFGNVVSASIIVTAVADGG